MNNDRKQCTMKWSIFCNKLIFQLSRISLPFFLPKKLSTSHAHPKNKGEITVVQYANNPKVKALKYLNEKKDEFDVYIGLQHY